MEKKTNNEIKSFCVRPAEAEIYRIFHPLVLHRLPAALTKNSHFTVRRILLFIEPFLRCDFTAEPSGAKNSSLTFTSTRTVNAAVMTLCCLLN